MIHLTLKTTRSFKSEEEFSHYCLSMNEQKVYTYQFWEDLFATGKSGFSSIEPMNETIVTTTGEVVEED